MRLVLSRMLRHNVTNSGGFVHRHCGGDRGEEKGQPE